MGRGRSWAAIKSQWKPQPTPWRALKRGCPFRPVLRWRGPVLYTPRSTRFWMARGIDFSLAIQNQSQEGVWCHAWRWCYDVPLRSHSRNEGLFPPAAGSAVNRCQQIALSYQPPSELPQLKRVTLWRECPLPMAASTSQEKTQSLSYFP